MPKDPSQPGRLNEAGESGLSRVRRRPWRRAGRFTLGMIVGLGVGVVACTRGPVAGWLVGSFVNRATGCSFEAAWTALNWDGRVVIDRVNLRAPGLAGDAGELLTAERIELQVDLDALRSGRAEIRSIALLRPVFRVSVGDDGAINMQQLTRGPGLGAGGPARGGVVSGGGVGGGGAGPVARLPTVTAVEGIFEAGEHDEKSYRALARLRVGGSIVPQRDDEYSFSLAEQVPAGMPAESAIRLEGQFNVRRGDGSAQVNSVRIDDWTNARVPAAVRPAWERLGMTGLVDRAEIRVSRAEGVELDLAVRDVAINLPVDSDRPELSGGRSLRMTDVSGDLRLRQGGRASGDGSIQAAIRGLIADLPCEVQLSTDGLDPITAGVSLQLWARDFRLGQNPALLPYVPPVVRQGLAQFSGPTAIISAAAGVRRSKTQRPPVGPPEPGQWTIGGSVEFSQGRAAFDQFPYPFYDLQGRITFDDDTIEIVDVTGRSLTGATLLASGRTWPTTQPNDLVLDVDVVDAPLDEVLEAAVDQRVRVAARLLTDLSVEAVERARAQAATQVRVRRAAAGGAGAAGDGPAGVQADGGAEVAGGASGRRGLLRGLLGEGVMAELDREPPSWRAGLYRALFSEEEFQRLTADGLVLTPGQKAELQARLDTLRRERAAIMSVGGATDPAGAVALEAMDAQQAALMTQLQAPEFEFGGRVSRLKLAIRKNPERDYFDAFVNVQLEQAGIVPDAFPLPLYAERLDLDILEHEVRLRAQVGRGVRGGSAEVSGRIDLAALDRTGGLPELHIRADELLVDELLVRAIPDADPSGESGRPDARSALRALNLRGLVDCTADIVPNQHGRADVDVNVLMNGLSSRPTPGQGGPGLLLSGVTGRIRSGGGVLVIDDLVAQVRPGDAPSAVELASDQFTGPPSIDVESARVEDRPGLLRASTALRWGSEADGSGTSIEASIDLRDFDLAARVEDVFSTFAPQLAKDVQSWRAARAPQGLIDAHIQFESGAAGGPPGLASRLDATLVRSEGLGLLTPDGWLEIRHDRGWIDARLDTLTGAAGAQVTLRMLGVEAAVSLDGNALGELALDGDFTLENPLGSPSLHVPRGLAVTVRDGRVQAGSVRSLLGAAAPQGLADWLIQADVHGQFDADLRLSPRNTPPGAPGERGAGGWVGNGVGAGVIVRGEVYPGRLGLSRRGQTVEVDQVSGRVSIDDAALRLEGLRGVTSRWMLLADGRVDLPREAGEEWTLALELRARAQSLDESLLAVLPDQVRESVERAGVRAGGGLELEKGTLVLAGGGRAGSVKPGELSVRRGVFDGVLSFAGLSADVGVEIEDAEGRVAIRADLDPGGGPALVTMDFDAPVLRAAGLLLAAGKARVEAGGPDGLVRAPRIEGELYGGRVSARAVARAGRGVAGEEGGPLTYEAGVSFAGVRFADVLAELDRRAAERRRLTFVGPPVPDELRGEFTDLPPLPPAPVGDMTRGKLDAELSLAGVVGDGESRRGRGSLRISGGDVVRLPLLLQMIELSNLQLPVGESLDFAQSTYYLAGRQVVFDHVAILSRSLSILGYGRMTLPDFDLDLRFNSRATSQIPILSGLFEGLRNELITTTVRGTIDNPEFGAEQFSGFRRAFDTILGRRDVAVMPDFERVEGSARAERARSHAER
jgi:hypothetical protein